MDYDDEDDDDDDHICNVDHGQWFCDITCILSSLDATIER